MGHAVADSDTQEAQRRAMQLSYANVRSEKAKIAQERNPDKHSLEAGYGQGRQVPHLQN